ncbi:MAG: hypothetical protein HZY79_15160 [Rhodoblastus sp.]|nr:MAG: hypothetical protein HZY79_15160 [Rhodoblastus sp.]
MAANFGDLISLDQIGEALIEGFAHFHKGLFASFAHRASPCACPSLRCVRTRSKVVCSSGSSKTNILRPSRSSTGVMTPECVRAPPASRRNARGHRQRVFDARRDEVDFDSIMFGRHARSRLGHSQFDVAEDFGKESAHLLFAAEQHVRTRVAPAPVKLAPIEIAMQKIGDEGADGGERRLRHHLDHASEWVAPVFLTDLEYLQLEISDASEDGF